MRFDSVNRPIDLAQIKSWASFVWVRGLDPLKTPSHNTSPALEVDGKLNEFISNYKGFFF